MKIIKKCGKLIALAALCAVAVTSLTSCSEIDRLKDERVIVLEDDIMEYRGTKYKKLNCPAEIKLNYERNAHLYAVEKDFPLLLIENYGESCYYSASNDMLIKQAMPYLSFDVSDYYCTLDKYAEYSEIINKMELNRYKFEYRKYEPGNSVRSTASYILDETLTKYIDDARALGETKAQSMHVFDQLYENWVFVKLDMCDDTDLIEEKGAVELCRTHDGKYLWVRGEGTDSDLVTVYFTEFPAESYDALEKLFSDYESKGAAYELMTGYY